MPPPSGVRQPRSGEVLEPPSPADPSSAAAWETSEYQFGGYFYAGNGNQGPPVGSRHSLVRASAGYAARVTGEPGGGGITVAVVDDGVDFSHPDLDGEGFAFSGNLSPGDHGTPVAGVIAARRDGQGMHGVAYNANLVSVGVGLSFDATAAGIASAAGLTRTYGRFSSAPAASSHIVNISRGAINVPSAPQFTSVMRDAADAGRIMVVSLGNCGAGGPDCSANGGTDDGLGPTGAPAANVADPDIAGFGIAVGSLDEDGAGRAAHSNTCGSVSRYCVFAPGENVPTTIPGGGYNVATGTSYAAPYVAGAAAVVWGAFPNKSGDEIVARLLDTADSSGVFGDTATYGQGKLDLGAAMNPVGSTSLSVEGLGMVPVADSFVDLPPGFGVEHAAAALSDAVVHDEQMFPFYQDLSPAFRPRGNVSATSALDDFLSSLGRSSRVSLPSGKASFAFTMADDPLDREGDRDLTPRTGDVETWRLRLRPTEDLAIGFGSGLDATGASNEFVAGRVYRTMLRDGIGPFAAFAGAGSALGADWRLDDATSFDFVGKEGTGRLGSSHALLTSFGVTHRLDDGLMLGARYGALREDGSLLGIHPSGAFGSVSGVSTRFIDMSAAKRVGKGLTLFGGASFGWTGSRAQGGPSLVSEWEGSQAESLLVGGELEGLWLPSDQLVVTASLPFRARKAAVRVEVPVEEVADGVVRRETRTIDLTPTGREARLQFAYGTGDRGGVSLSVGGYLRFRPDHDASADPDLGLAAKVGVDF